MAQFKEDILEGVLIEGEDPFDGWLNLEVILPRLDSPVVNGWRNTLSTLKDCFFRVHLDSFDKVGFNLATVVVYPSERPNRGFWGFFVLTGVLDGPLYDWVLEEPQARLERSAVTDLEVTTDAVDRAFDTQTVRLDGVDDNSPTFRLTVPNPDELEGDDANTNESLALVHVRDHRRLVDALGASWRLDEPPASPSR